MRKARSFYDRIDERMETCTAQDKSQFAGCFLYILDLGVRKVLIGIRNSDNLNSEYVRRGQTR
jgi:hypothetical protein